MLKDYRLQSHPAADAANMIAGDKYRITFLTEALVRLEYSEDGIFEDRATQVVLNRNFPQSGLSSGGNRSRYGNRYGAAASFL